MQLQICSWIDDLGGDAPFGDPLGALCCSPGEAADVFAVGGAVLICDLSAGELVAELCVPAEGLTTKKSAFLVRHTSGIMTATIDTVAAQRLDLPPLRLDFERDAGRFCVAVDAKSRTTGISAQDRARTITRIADIDAKPTDFDRPGHVLPVVTGGAFAGARWTRYDAAAALSRRAGLSGVVASAPLVDGLGATAVPFVADFARAHQLNLVFANQLKPN
ncbi:3,4-dihydroxy-2-butanone-4-phosphate synthase [Mycolicibacterium hippocampi]|uniref:3,4-dihydroxy-2-butanone-4-phosphate synthase n=1 Tax=Mycolicibacterium hippocampi TaxID=659824 RepID=A0A7I9ZHP6_9MYCO|nr:3,4-dihydroxy-2-butanone-4-phosphate synthase [Mycolicibacterium hippocampi]GFH00552.1 hypothetical protein MHIP_10350 [Mycolicibacterium hippocampi]